MSTKLHLAVALKETRRAASLPHHTPSEGALGWPQGEGVTARHSRPRDPERSGSGGHTQDTVGKVGPATPNGGGSGGHTQDTVGKAGPETPDGGGSGGHTQDTAGKRTHSPQKGLSSDRWVGLLKTILKQGSQETQKYKNPFRGLVAEVAKKLPSRQQV